MQITHYLALVNHSYQPKNKLEKATLEFISNMDRTLIEAADIEFWKQKVEEKIALLNAEYKACKPIKLTYGNGFPVKGDIIIYGLNMISFGYRACFDPSA